jgi:hypothetical protein
MKRSSLKSVVVVEPAYYLIAGVGLVARQDILTWHERNPMKRRKPRYTEHGAVGAIFQVAGSQTRGHQTTEFTCTHAHCTQTLEPRRKSYSGKDDTSKGADDDALQMWMLCNIIIDAQIKSIQPAG